jgi:acyl-coenzyme A synthetase/AMP-(fatty) acid ligase
MVKPLRPLLGPRVKINGRRPTSPGVVPRLAAERFGPVPIGLDRPLDVDPRGRTELDYAALADIVDELSAALVEAGVGPWDRVAVVKSQNFDIPVLAAAAARIGAIPVLIARHLDGRAIGVLLSRLRTPFVVTDQSTVDASNLPAERWRELSRRLIGPVEGGTPLEDLYGAPVPPPNPRRDDEPVFVTHTGGTTGVPKLIQQSVANASRVIEIEARRWPFAYSPDERLGAYLTWVHARAIYYMTALLTRGPSLTALADSDPENVVRMFQRHRPTMIESHPNTYMRWEELADHPADPFRDVRVYFNSFDAIHPRTIRTLLDASRRRAPLWVQGYGMSELGLIALRFYTRRTARNLGTRGLGSRNVGWSIPGYNRVRIVDPRTQRRVARGETGMIQVRSRTRTIGFIDQPDKYWGRVHGQWFDTGDIGRPARFGSFELLDREIDRIEGVESCLLIEDKLFDRMPELTEIVIVADDASRPVPIVCTAGDVPIDPSAWRKATADLPQLGEPVHVNESELPRTESAKARRFLIAERTKGGDVDTVILRDGA